MKNPFSPGFAAPSMAHWCKATRWWLRRHGGLKTEDLAAMTGLAPNTIQMLCNKAKSQLWFCELLGALVLGWRPETAWGHTLPQDRLRRLDTLLESPEELRGQVWKLVPIAPTVWETAVWEGRASDIPPRMALMIEAVQANVVPCGLPFEDWTP